MADTPEAVAQRLIKFIRAEGQRGAKQPGAWRKRGFQQQLYEDLLIAPPSMEQTYAKCLGSLRSDAERIALDRVIEALSEIAGIA